MLENLAVVLIAPALPCPVRNQVSVDKPDWSTVPFIMADQGRYAVALSYGSAGIKSAIRRFTPPSAVTKRWSQWWRWAAAALLPEVVLENSPEPVRNRVMILERSDEKRRLNSASARKKAAA